MRKLRTGRGDNNVYAGRDGSVYRNDGDGWSKYENGDWNNVDSSQVAERAVDRGIDRDAARQRTEESNAARASGERAGTMDQLQRDRQARERGDARSRDYDSWRSGASGRYGRSSGQRGGGGRRGGRRR